MVAFKRFKIMTLIAAFASIFFGERFVQGEAYLDLLHFLLIFLAFITTVESSISFYEGKKMRNWVGILGGIFFMLLAFSRFT
ncbi:hypothetical protein [Atopococcus tabaci]|uniref:hypothetical protein n=1 Tax=Atopococcus tabaci TaxID=269774 RepID=UPI000409B71F|nr:hypothetical protein [Atopococcus tabaci]